MITTIFESLLIQINIGVINADPSTTDGTIDIMKTLHKYVPIINGKLHTVPCHADGASCEHMQEAHRHRNADLTPEDRLEGLEETPQEFHHRGNMMKVSFLFFSRSSHLLPAASTFF